MRRQSRGTVGRRVGWFGGGAVTAGGHRVEALEPRRLLTITVDGTGGNDTLVVNRAGNDLHVTLNGSPRTIGIGNEIILEVHGLGGNDTITVGNLTDADGSLLADVFGDDGNDTITLGSVLLASAQNAHGGAGANTVVLDDTSGAGARDYRLIASILNGGTAVFVGENASGAADLFVHEAQTLRLLTNNFANTVDIQDRLQNFVSTYDVRLGGGDDTLNFARSNGTGVVQFAGAGGTDTFNYADENADNTSFVVGAGSLAEAGSTVATWELTQVVRLDLNGGDDTIRVNAVAGGVDVTVNSGAGDDAFTVGNNDVDLNILGPLHLIGGGGGDRVTFDDSDGAPTGPNDSYTLGTGTLSKTGLANPITFSVAGRSLLCNGGSNAVTVVPDLFDSFLNVSGNAGDDVITYGNGSLRGPDTTITGGSGSDTVVFDDADPVGGIVTAKDYTFKAGVMLYFLNGSQASSHDYSAEAIVLNAGAYDSAFNVISPGTETSLAINAGGGGDTLTLTPVATAATVSFAGESGADAVVIDDTANPSTLAMTYTLEKTSFDMTGFGLLNFGGAESLALKLSDGGDVVNVNGVATGVPTTITGGFDPDTFNVGGGDFDSNVSANLSIQGNQGGDRLVLDDAADTGDDAYTLVGGVFSKGNVAVTVTYNTLEHVEVNGSAGDNAFTFVSPGFALDVTMRGFAGADTFEVTPSARATVSVEGSDPTVPPGDVLRFAGAAPAGSATLTPNGAVNGTYAFAAAKTVSFTGIETFPAVPAAPGAPDLDDNDDTGLSKTDNVTRSTKPLISGRAARVQAVELRAGALQLGSAVADERGAYALQAVFPADGVYAVQAFGVDPASGLTGPGSPALVVTIDTVAPSAPQLPPDLVASSDSGLSATDNVTNDTTPTFAGPATGADVVRLRAASGALLGSDTSTGDGSYSITTPPLADGLQTATATFEDLAGNVSPPGFPMTFVIDTVAPAPPTAAPDLLSSSDTGVSDSDNITRAPSPRLVEAVPDGAIVRLFDGVTQVGIDTNTTSGLYEIAAILSGDGAVRLAARFEDLAGNFGALGPALLVTVDTVAPFVTASVFDRIAGDALRFTFSEDIGPSLSASDLTVRNLTEGADVPASEIALAYAPVTANFTFPNLPGGQLPADRYSATISPTGVFDAAGNGLAVGLPFAFDTLPAPALARLFYNRSSFDGADPAATAADDAAIAPDKQPRLPGQAATFANVSTYSRGINGIFIDLAGIPPAQAPGADDVVAQTGDGTTFASAPAPAASLRRGAGEGGTDRLTLIWPDGAIRDTWLKVTVLATPRTGLAAPLVFFFGNLIADTGDSASAFRVNALDLGRVKTALNGASTLTGRFDFNRDGRVNALDLGLVKANLNKSLASIAAGTSAARSPFLTVAPAANLAGETSVRRVWDEPAAPLL